MTGTRSTTTGARSATTGRRSTERKGEQLREEDSKAWHYMARKLLSIHTSRFQQTAIGKPMPKVAVHLRSGSRDRDAHNYRLVGYRG